jgi:elongation factor G
MTGPHPRQRPIITVVITPQNSADWESLERALDALAREDPIMTVERTEDNVLIGGIGELHLQIICDRIAREFKIPLTAGEPKIIYLEKIRQPSEAEGKYVRQLGGHGQYAHVKLRLEPGDAGSGYQFIDSTSEDVVPPQFVPSIDAGIQEAMKGGVLAGNEIVDVRAILRGGSYHAEDSSEVAFKIAATIAFKEAARKAKPVILEPLMAIGVYAPEEFAGAVIADLQSRRGRIVGIESKPSFALIRAIAPLKELLGYRSKMRAMTEGRGSLDLRFSQYEALPGRGESEQEEIGVPADKPSSPTPKSGSATAQPDDLGE